LVSDSYSNIIRGGPLAYKTIAPQVDFARQQFSNARRELRNTVPAGGAWQGANKNLAANEAQTVSNLYRDNLMNAVNGLAGFSQANTQGSLNATGGQSAAANSLAQLAAQRAQAFNSGIGGIAGALGTAFGMGGLTGIFGGGAKASTPPYTMSPAAYASPVVGNFNG
jgi:hypothetical protein